MWSPPKSQSKISYLWIVFVGILLGLGILATWLFKIEPFYDYITGFMPTIQNLANYIKTLVPTVTSYLAQNPTALISLGITGATVIGGTLWKMHIESQKAQLEAQAQEAVSNYASLGMEYQKAQEQIKALQTKVNSTSSDSSGDALTEATNLLTEKNSQITKLKDQLEILSGLANPSESQMIEKLKLLGYEVKLKQVIK